MYCLRMGLCSEKCIIRQFHCVNIIKCIYTNLDGTAHYTPRPYGIAYRFLTSNLYSMLLYKNHMRLNLAQEN